MHTLVQKVKTKMLNNNTIQATPRFKMAFWNNWKSIRKIERPKPPYKENKNAILKTNHAIIKTKIWDILPLVPNRVNHPPKTP